MERRKTREERKSAKVSKVEKVSENEYVEWDEAENMEYAIKWETDEGGWVKKLTLESYYRPLGRNYANGIDSVWGVSINGNDLDIEYSVIHYDWDGTGRTEYKHIAYETDSDTELWFSDPGELEDAIKGNGVKATIEGILDTLDEILKVKE